MINPMQLQRAKQTKFSVNTEITTSRHRTTWHTTTYQVTRLTNFTLRNGLTTEVLSFKYSIIFLSDVHVEIITGTPPTPVWKRSRVYPRIRTTLACRSWCNALNSLSKIDVNLWTSSGSLRVGFWLVEVLLLLSLLFVKRRTWIATYKIHIERNEWCKVNFYLSKVQAEFVMHSHLSGPKLSRPSSFPRIPIVLLCYREKMYRLYKAC